MISEDQILSEIQKINQNLDKINSRSSLAKNSLNNLVAGFFHSVGNLIGTIIIFLVLLFLASRLNLNKLMVDYFEKMMTGVNWSKILPSPKIEFNPPLL